MTFIAARPAARRCGAIPRPPLRFVRIGALDEPEALPPDVHIFTRSKLLWVGLPADVPAYEIITTCRRCGLPKASRAERRYSAE